MIQSIPPNHEYDLPDTIEIAGLAAVIQDPVTKLNLPVSPLDRDADGVITRFMRDRWPELGSFESPDKETSKRLRKGLGIKST
ncbi:MAG: hypothetical protein ACI841_004862 [Planctomycetota bacterium]